MAPRDIILEPNEKVILATRPLFLWEPLVIIDILLLVLALYFTPIQPALMVLFLAVFALLTLWLLVQWIPWSAKWFVLTDRRVISRWGVVNRNQSALLLDRVGAMVKEGKSLDDIKKEVKMPEYASWGSQDRFPTNVEAAYKAVAGK